jgi:predicted metal-dependent phosphoesterase TrpH
MLLDLHIHTKYSGDATIEPKDLIKVAQERELDGIAVTDHNTTRGWNQFQEKEELFIIKGVEQTTEYGSVIGLFLNEKIESNEFYEVVDAIRDQDGIIMIPHPFDSLRKDSFKINSVDIKTLEKCVDAIEVFNSRCILNSFNENAEKLANTLHKHRLAGSDAHTRNEIGNARTEFEYNTLEQIHTKLKEKTPIKTKIHGKLSGSFVHIYSFLSRFRKQY